MGCGGGGGRDAADVFRSAGLTFITNGNARPSASGTSAHPSIGHLVSGLIDVCVCVYSQGVYGSRASKARGD